MLPAGLGLALALAVSPERPAPAAPCGLRHPQECRDINALIDRPDFLRALRRFVGTARAPDDARFSKYQTAVEALHGPPEDRAEAAPGLLRFGACMSHYCLDKGAAFLTAEGELQALALLNVSCPPAGECREDRLVLDVTVAPERRAALEPLARAWAPQRIAADNAAYHPDRPSRLVAVTVSAPAPARLTPRGAPATPPRN